jgi:heme a synthase
MLEKKLTRFRRMALITIFATIFLIWVGGLVRSTGSGMGCPDWPKCFGQIVPPTDVSQLPSDYKEHYSELRKEKNKRIAARLEKMGFGEVAHKIMNDPKVYVEEDFNATKTWIEYLNRLVGVLIGLFIFLTMVFSFSLRQYDRKIMLLSILGFILVLLEGFLGSIVVSTNLMPGMITVHMLLAMVLLVVLINAYQRSMTDWEKVEIPSFLKYLGVGVSLIVLVQILFGTQLREAIDVAKDALGEEQRENWLAYAGNTYLTHRFFYYVVVIAMAFWIYKLKPFFLVEKKLKKWAFAMGIFVFIEIALGLGMHYFAIPSFIQPLHLLFSTLIFASVYYLTNILYRITK